MSELKGTPGPWSCAYNGYFFDIKPKGSHQDLAITHANKHIGIDKSVEQANANLIAAAPELLEALQEMVAIVKNHTYPQPDKPSSTWVRMEAAEAAIAKALAQ